ncbi:MAG: 6-phosphogluconolactonase [Rhodospirillales bacterium]|nr:6-phosphogluconolactonase [Rhodospirillales bacterium]
MIPASSDVVEILDDHAAVARRGTDWLLATIAANPGRIAVALSGGSTPKLLYQLLAAPPLRDAVPWSRIHWFWGDERFVPQDDPKSNFRMVREAMLAAAPVPPENLHPVPTTGVSPDEAAGAYERELQAFYGAATLDPSRPLFDAMLLGLGPDGHTASLFPGTAVLAERARWAAAVVGAQPEPRITLTFPVIDSSRAVAFLVSGAEKRQALAGIRRGDPALPASRVRPVGTLTWLVDRAAAG